MGKTNLPDLSNCKLILASQSPRRRDLLRSVGLSFDIQPANFDEDSETASAPLEYVKNLACSKAAVIASRNPQALVIAADTIVVLSDTNPDLDGEIINKPLDAKHAREMLAQLTGRAHYVLTAFCLQCEAEKYLSLEVVQSQVKLKKLSTAEIDCYVRSGEPLDKAGAYAVQGKGAYFFESIAGSYTNVVGLPLTELVSELKKIGAWKSEYLLCT